MDQGVEVKETRPQPENYINTEGAWKIPKLILRRPEEVEDAAEKAELEEKLKRQWKQHKTYLTTEPLAKHFHQEPQVNYEEKDWQEATEEEYYLVEKEPIGRGMSNVYRAWDNHLKEVVVVKIMPPHTEHPHLLELEAETIARIRHPGIPIVFNYQKVQITDENSIYKGRQVGIIFMEYIKAPTLSEELIKRPFTPQEIIKIVKDLAETIDYMNKQGLSHGDLKPANILLDPDHTKITDFGLSSWTVSWKGERRGTAEYMAPETTEGKGLTPQSGVFSLATIAYQMLTLELPFKGSTPHEIKYRIQSEEVHPTSPSQLISKQLVNRLGRGGRDELDMVFKQALAKNPTERYPNATFFAQELEEVLKSALIPKKEPQKHHLLDQLKRKLTFN